MPQIIITKNATHGLERCRQFLKTKSKTAAKRATQIISQHFTLLEQYPDIGRPHTELPELKEFIIDFGASGYVALYRYNKTANIVYILSFRHQKEAGYLTELPE